MTSSMSVRLLTSCLVIAVTVQIITATASWNFITSLPRRLSHSRTGNTTILLEADTALVACQCRTFKDSHDIGPIMDFSLGANSLDYKYKHTSYFYNAKFIGRGLENGKCGVFMSNMYIIYNLLVCRARSSVGDWKYQETALVFEGHAGFTLTVPSRHVVLPHTTASPVCASDRRLVRCTIWLPFERVAYEFNTTTQDLEHKYNYYGTGLKSKQCGVTINVTESKQSGPVWCRGAANGEKYLDESIMNTVLLVAEPPTQSELLLPTSSFTDGETLTATCTVSESIPVANITWLLGDQVIRQDQVDDEVVADPEWSWPWNKRKITQELVHTVRLQDNGKSLECQVDHVALEKILIKKSTITVRSTVLVPKLAERCGEKGPSRVALVAGGYDAVSGEYPWHAGIFQQKGTSYAQLCGGTLVTPRLVITAAHCMWSNKLNEFNDKSIYRVVLGKIKLAWDDLEDGQQVFTLQSILTLPRFEEHYTVLQHDIALIILSNPAAMTTTVGVACVDWENRREAEQLAEGKKGIATGWGLTVNGKTREILQSVSLPWVSDDTCWTSIPRNRRKYFTYDKFCAGLLNSNTSVCPGDSGGGLLFQDSAKKLYLRGVVSNSFAPAEHISQVHGCYAEHYTSFTKISTYIEWIKGYRNL